MACSEFFISAQHKEAAITRSRPLFICGYPAAQNRPVILPFSSTSIFSAAGTLGRPGMVRMSPVRATMNPAPAETFTFRTVRMKS